MHLPHTTGFLQRGLFRALDVLEARVDALNPWRVIPWIVGIGLGVTLAVAAIVWTADRQRDQRDFDALARQTHAQVADRLIYQRWKLERLSERWSSGVLPPASSGSGFAPGEVLTLRRDMPAVETLMGWQHLAEPGRAVLRSFWSQVAQAMTPVDGVAISPAVFDTSGAPRWFMVLASPATDDQGRSRGWVISPIDARGLLPRVGDVPGWQMAVSLTPAAQVLPGPHDARLLFQTAVMSAGTGEGPWLLVRGEPMPRSWSERAARHAGLAIAALAGLLCTVGAVYGYLMLISIRWRAQAIARRATADLGRSEARNRAVLDTAPDAIVMVDEQCRVVWCNQATVGIFGRTLEEMLGQPLAEVVPVLDGQSLEDWFHNHGIADRVLSFETRGRRAEGTEFPISVSASRARIEGETLHTFFVRDTTDAKWAEHELLLRERALASSAEAITICDMTLPGRPIIFANPAFERTTGYEFHEVMGQNPRFLHGDEHDQPGCLEMSRAIKDGRACQVVVRNYRKDGTLFWNEMTISPVKDAEGQITHYVGVGSDITERMASEQVLHLRTERLNAVFDLSPDGFVVLDRLGVVNNVNPAFERMTGLEAGQVVGLTHDELEQRLLALCSFIEYDAEKGDVVDAPGDGAEAPPPVSTQRELLHIVTPTPRTLVRRIRHGADDRDTVMYFRDITQELEVDRMKSEFLSMAAHELRTPMASIFGFTELLLRRKFDDARRQDMLSTIHRQASILINLINELLDLARIESRRGKDFKRQRQTLQPVIQATVNGLLMNNDRRQVQLSLPAEPIEVDIDAEKLQSALTNVLSNAYKYSPQGGDIELDVAWRDHEGRVECGIRVTDHGIGMTPEQVARVFERFFRADTSGNIPGTGLGMTIVKEIVELHGGEVSLLSESGVGSTVVLWLPVLGLERLAPAESDAAEV